MWSFCFFIPPQRPMTPDLEGFSIPDFIHYIYFPILILEKSQYFPFQCSVLNKGTTGTIFITSLVWRGPWLGIEPGTSRTRSQPSTTRLSRRRSLTGDWTRDPLALEASTLPLGYRRGGVDINNRYMYNCKIITFAFICDNKVSRIFWMIYDSSLWILSIIGRWISKLVF